MSPAALLATGSLRAWRPARFARSHRLEDQLVQRIARRAAAVAVGLTLAATGLAVSTPAAQATAIGKTAANVQPLTNIHQCKALGDDTVTKAVMCVDVIVDGNDFYAQTEAFCQTMATAQIVRCSNISVTFEAWRTDPGGQNFPTMLAHLTKVCGHTNGQCPAGRYVNSIWILDFCGDFAFTRIKGLPTLSTFIDLPGTNQRRHLEDGDFDSTHTLLCP